MPKQTILTQEYFEKKLEKSFKSFGRGIKEHVTNEIADLAAIQAHEFHRADERFDRVERKLDRVVLVSENHEKRLKRVERAIGVPETV